MRKLTAVAAVAVAVVLVALLFGALAPAAPVTAQNTACYRPVGGASFECGSGGSFVVKDGATLEVQSGGTLTLAAGSTAALGPDIVAAVSDMTLTTITATTGIIDDITASGAVGAADLTASDDLVVGDDAVIAGTATITEDVTLVADVGIGGNVDVTGNVEVVDHLLTQAEFYMIPPAAVTVTNGGIITPTGAVVELTAAGTVGSSLAPAVDGQFLILINTASQTITISETSTARIAGDFAMGQYDTITLIGQGVTWHEVARSNN